MMPGNKVSASDRSSKTRDLSLDLFKAILIIGMVAGHTMSMLGYYAPGTAGHYFCQWINFVTFSGFFFCFGQTSFLAYLSRSDLKPRRVLYNVGRIMAAYYISAFSSYIIYSGLSNISDIKALIFTALLYNVPMLSEFLLSFAGLNSLIYIYWRIKKA